MELSQVYAPVSGELEEIKQTLTGIRRVRYEWLAEQLAHVVRGTGKVIRPALTLLAGKTFPTFEKNRAFILPMGVSVELMHTATLVHDDAIDKAATRRGQPTMNSIWGDEIAILMGDYLFAKAGEYVADTQSPRAIKLFSQTLGIISSGEIGQFRGAFNADQSRDDYFHRIYSKTGSLFSLSTQTGALLAGADEAAIAIMKDYGDNLGIAFQIVDDILDFTSTPEKLGKPVGSDLRQGTLTLPAMLVMERHPANNPVRTYFRARDDRYAHEAVDMVLNADIIETAYAVAAEFRDRACRDLMSLPDTVCRRSLLDLGEYIVNQGR